MVLGYLGFRASISGFRVFGLLLLFFVLMALGVLGFRVLYAFGVLGCWGLGVSGFSSLGVLWFRVSGLGYVRST